MTFCMQVVYQEVSPIGWARDARKCRR